MRTEVRSILLRTVFTSLMLLTALLPRTKVRCFRYRVIKVLKNSYNDFIQTRYMDVFSQDRLMRTNNN